MLPFDRLSDESDQQGIRNEMTPIAFPVQKARVAPGRANQARNRDAILLYFKHDMPLRRLICKSEPKH